MKKESNKILFLLHKKRCRTNGLTASLIDTQACFHVVAVAIRELNQVCLKELREKLNMEMAEHRETQMRLHELTEELEYSNKKLCEIHDEHDLIVKALDEVKSDGEEMHNRMSMDTIIRLSWKQKVTKLLIIAQCEGYCKTRSQQVAST